MMSRILLLLFFGSTLAVNAQLDHCDYTLSAKAIPYTSEGQNSKAAKLIATIKEDLAIDVENISAVPQKDYRLAYHQGADYLIELLKNDFFLFEESLTTKVEQLAEQIIAANDIQRSHKMRFLIGRTGIPNAFTMRDGTIVINLGLLSRLDNWDQLAFVLCHEMAHHHEDHVNQKINKQIQLFNSSAFKAKLKAAKKGKALANQELEALLKESGLSYAKHSRDAELETDALGFEFYKKAGFPIEQAHSALKMLKALDFPKLELPALDQLFSFTEIPWKEEWTESQLSGLSLVALSEDEKEAFRTHPQVSERIEQIVALGARDSTQLSFPLCEQSLLFDLEILAYYYTNENTFQAFLLAMQLTTITMNNAFVMETIANCLLDFTIARKEHRFSHFVPLPGRRLSDPENELATFLDNLRLSELAALSKGFIQKYIDLNNSSTAVVTIKEKLKIIEN